jgi:hypothetical protein
VGLLNRILLGVFLLMGVQVVSHANALKDAWNCAKDSANVTFEMASKGTKAMEVLGSSPTCVAQALVPDAPLLAISGAMVAINAIDSSVLPQQGCEASLKTTAAFPVAKLLNEIAPSGTVANMLKGEANAAAQDQIWTLLNTPPLDQFTSRASCGCVFLEAGISVETLKDMLQAIGKAGKSCDKFLDNVPGYTPIKNAAKESVSLINNLGEDLLTSQVQHMPVPQYFEQYFEAYPNSWRVQSHAVAKAMNPGHDSKTMGGASVIANQYFAADGGGAVSGMQLRSGCVAYFDDHKMSKSNAEKTCDILISQFDAYYQQFVPIMVARDKTIKAIIPGLAAIREKAQAQCEPLYANESSVDKTNSVLSCKEALQGLQGRVDYPNPYDQVGSLGTPIPESTVNQWLKGKSVQYYLPPVKAHGMYARAYDILGNSASNSQQAIKFTLAAYQMAVDSELNRRKKKIAAAKKAAQEAKVKNFQQDVGGYWSDKCPASQKSLCVDRLVVAWEQCNSQFNNTPCTAETKSKDVCTLDSQWMAKTNKQCQSAYLETTLAFNDRANKLSNMGQQIKSLCPSGAGGLQQQKAASQCAADYNVLLEKCLGGVPTVRESYFQNGKLSRTPEPLANCSGAINYFTGKWGADEKWVATANGMYSSTAQACIKLGLPGCQEELGKKTDACIALIRNDALTFVAPAPFDSTGLTNGLQLLKKHAQTCIESMRLVPEKLGKGKEIVAMALQQYGSQCPSRDEHKDWGKLCRDELQQVAQDCTNGTSPAGSAAGGAKTAMAADIKPKTGQVNVNTTRNVDAVATQARSNTHVMTTEQQLDSCKPKLQAVLEAHKKQAEARKTGKSSAGTTFILMKEGVPSGSGSNLTVPPALMKR